MGLVFIIILLQNRLAPPVLNEDQQQDTLSDEATGVTSLHNAAADENDTSGSDDKVMATHRGLRFDWSNVPVQSPIAKTLQAWQQNCSIPVKHYAWRSYGVGMGSDLHAWGNALWAGLNDGHRIRSPKPWLWVDQEACGSSSLLECHFPIAEPKCEDETVQKGRIVAGPCGKRQTWTAHNYTVPEFRAAATEFAFSSLSQVVVKEAQKQRHSLFGNAITPPNLITVHIRWGDNALEVRRQNTPIQRYVQAIETMIQDNNLKSSVHILLCTEDPVALDAFQEATKTKDWTIHVDPFYTKYLPYRKDREIKYNLASHISTQTNGKAGLWALGSLLVAVEANYFVLTTKSNWSRLMNELRKNVVDPSCQGCTKMLDIDEGEC